MKRNFRDCSIDWYKEKDFLKKSLEEGKTFSYLQFKVYNLDSNTIKKAAFLLGLLGNTKEEIVDYAITKFKNKGSRFPATDRYLRKKLAEDPLYCAWWTTGQEWWTLIHRDDYIDSFLKSHNAKSEDLWKYDFSSLPEIIKNKLEPQTIKLCVHVSKRTGEKLWVDKIIDWEHTIHMGSDPFCISASRRDKDSNDKLVLAKLDEKFGENFEFSISPTSRIKVLVRCKKCGEVFERERSVIGSNNICCPKCQDRTPGGKPLTLEEFINRANKVYKPGRFGYDRVVYTKSNDKIEIKDLESGQYFWVAPSNFLKGYCKGTWGYPSGERHIQSWLDENNFKDQVDYFHEKYVHGIKGQKSDMISIDFILNYHGKTYWIEYNGEQHYRELALFHKDHNDYLNQIGRDQEEARYCENNNIILVAIPFKYKTYARISEVLTKIIINGQSTDIIEQPEIQL